MTVPEIPTNRTKRVIALIGQIAALLIASFCALVTAWFLYDVAYVAHSANDWGDPAAFDVFLIWIVNIPGCILSSALAIFIRPIRRGLLVPTLVLVFGCLLLMFLVPASTRLNKARQQKKTDDMTRAMESHGY